MSDTRCVNCAAWLDHPDDGGRVYPCDCEAWVCDLCLPLHLVRCPEENKRFGESAACPTDDVAEALASLGLRYGVDVVVEAA